MTSELRQFAAHCRLMAMTTRGLRVPSLFELAGRPVDVPSAAERQLWTRLADEIDDYLGADEDQPLLDCDGPML